MAEEKQIFDKGEDCTGGWKASMADYDEAGSKDSSLHLITR